MRYRVIAKSWEYLYIDVEADSKSEAFDIAEQTDGGEFNSYETKDEGWDITGEIEELKGE